MDDQASNVIHVEEDELRPTSADELIANSDLTEADVERADEVARQGAKGRSLVTLTEYQKLIVTAVRKFIAVMVCRQGGKTFASTLRIARKLLSARMPYYILSRSERQSANAVAQLATHLRAVERALAAKGKKIGGTPRYFTQKLLYRRGDGSEFEYNRLSAALPNGSKAIGLPASPDTIMGISGSVYGDEFALHKQDREIFGRLFPVISRLADYEMLLTSTPRGVGTKFYEIMTSGDYEEVFLRVTVDIFTAVRQGLVLFDYEGKAIKDDAGIERLRKALKDPEMWAEEYLCQFVDDVLNLLTHELIGRCERLHNEDGKPYELIELDEDFDPAKDDLAKRILERCKTGQLFLGFDQARRRHLSVIWLDEELEGRLWARALLVMDRKDFEFQEAVLWQLCAMARVRKAGIDATGMGARTAERAVTRWAEKVVPVDFSGMLTDRNGTKHKVKALLARVILERHQDGLDRYPVMDRIRDDFHKVKRKRGGSPDTFTYFADDDETGHADIFTAKALSDVVAQELREYAGRVDGMRVRGQRSEVGGQMEEDDIRPEKPARPDHSSDWQKPQEEFAGIGEAF